MAGGLMLDALMVAMPLSLGPGVQQLTRPASLGFGLSQRLPKSVHY